MHNTCYAGGLEQLQNKHALQSEFIFQLLLQPPFEMLYGVRRNGLQENYKCVTWTQRERAPSEFSPPGISDKSTLADTQTVRSRDSE